MARIETNIKRVRKSVKDEQGRYTLRTRALARKMGAAARDNIRANIAPRPAGVFPGYAITGALARKVVSSEPQKEGNGWVCRVRVLLTGKQKLYAKIHEVGGVIRVKRALWLTFFIPGVGWRRKKKVFIRPKGYFRKGIERTRQEWSLARLRREF